MLKRLQLSYYDKMCKLRAKYQAKVGEPMHFTLEEKVALRELPVQKCTGDEVEHNGKSVYENRLTLCRMNQIQNISAKILRVGVNLYLDDHSWCESLPVVEINHNPYMLQPYDDLWWPVELVAGFREGVPRLVQLPMLLVPIAPDGIPDPLPPIIDTFQRSPTYTFDATIEMTLVPAQKDLSPSFELMFQRLMK